MDEFNPAILIAEYGFTTVAIVAMAYFVFYIWKFIWNSILLNSQSIYMIIINMCIS